MNAKVFCGLGVRHAPILDQPRMAGVLPEAIRLSIEIEFAAGARMGITGTVDAATLRAVVGALADGRQR